MIYSISGFLGFPFLPFIFNSSSIPPSLFCSYSLLSLSTFHSTSSHTSDLQAWFLFSFLVFSLPTHATHASKPLTRPTILRLIR
ncbi:hypothetical protein BKA90DRAFT_36005 [Yarrowia lipolytica]|nr:hypothetical protein BKA90DRAFT_36005 [Yarrowia lipolytica]